MESTRNSADWNRDDRDLLVELRTEMKGVRADIKNLSDGNNARLTLLEQGKLDRTEANRLQSESLDFHTKIETRVLSHEKAIGQLEDDAIIRQTEIKTLVKVWSAASIFINLLIAVFAVYVAYKFH